MFNTEAPFSINTSSLMWREEEEEEEEDERERRLGLRCVYIHTHTHTHSSSCVQHRIIWTWIFIGSAGTHVFLSDSFTVQVKLGEELFSEQVAGVRTGQRESGSGSSGWDAKQRSVWMLVLFLSDSHLSPPFLSLSHINRERHILRQRRLWRIWRGDFREQVRDTPRDVNCCRSFILLAMLLWIKYESVFVKGM